MSNSLHNNLSKLKRKLASQRKNYEQIRCGFSKKEQMIKTIANNRNLKRGNEKMMKKGLLKKFLRNILPK